ncbi:MAG TPA: arginase family protein [Gemmatimonadaceae bacterium]
MHRFITLVGAPCNIGIKPYDTGEPRRLDLAPSALRSAGLASLPDCDDDGDVVPEPYRDFVRPAGRPRNEAEMVRYCGALAERVAAVVRRGRFPVVLGGDCGIVLGSLLGLRRAGRQRVGLAYVDGHADFATPEESRTGSVASMCLGLAIGRGETPLARLAGDAPLVSDGDVALIGRRDQAEPWYGHAALHASAVLDLPHDAARTMGYGAAAEPVLTRVAAGALDGFWIHLDADVLSPAVMPAVDSPEEGGPDLDELAPFLAALVRHPKALGMELTIYDPRFDSDRVCARRLAALVGRALGARVGSETSATAA